MYKWKKSINLLEEVLSVSLKVSPQPLFFLPLYSTASQTFSISPLDPLLSPMNKNVWW